ncbi:Prephenate dehydratase [Archaeoglobus sulfaticallidus PM70-1]|uniref:Prephenate dehydrogenase n=1 Tax=Archaeoglobus sulfaticallidus PM70-1 TaxID=387631 RepID=N0BBK4_9EURY|nr:prephenate dehydratase [Archaeoglobus sulfaticallidus]AGK60979.1 Prephenate dehydratase [Archaeoglobus sulfaticallidus PM70-1]
MNRIEQKPKILIWGMGGMGTLFKKFFELRGYTVKGYDIDENKREVDEKDLFGFDVIFLCVPMDSIDSVISKLEKLSTKFYKKPLIVDIASVKSDLDKLIRNFDVLSIHPMIGPDSDLGLSNIIVVYESGREEGKLILDELYRAGANISRLNYRLHDHKMAEIQGVAHFLLIAMANFLKDRMDKNDLNYASPIFYTLYKLASRIINQDWRMYYNIQKNSEQLREELVKSILELHDGLRDDARFKEIFEASKKVFDDFGGSTIILDSARASEIPERDIHALRGYIRVVDSLILRLIERRVRAGKEIAMYKKEKNLPIEISEIEEVKLKELASSTTLNRMMLNRIFGEIFHLTKAEEYRILGISKRMAVLGPMGSFSDEVALKLTGSRVPFIYCSSVEEIVRMVEKDENTYGLIPIENSVHGTVLKSIDALMRYDVEVFGETKMEVIHVLASKKKLELTEIEEVYSHPQAMAQCAEFINNYLPKAKLRYTSSTSDAISMLKDTSAAIVSENAARLYNLYILRKGIQDMENNVTRFYIIRKQGSGEVDGNVTSLFFGVEDKPGALKDVLEVFYEKNINLRKLESRPSGTGLGDYIFFSEVEKRLNEDDLRRLRDVTTFYRVAGIFREVDRIEL